MKSLRFLAVLVLLHCWMTPLVAAFQNEGVYLDESFALSEQLQGSERLFYLQELTRVSTQINPAPAEAQEWCLTLFRMAAAEPDERARIAGEKNALWRLSYFNPGLAIDLLPQIDLQGRPPGQMLYEDLRSNAAAGIFVNFLLKLKPQGISTILAEARYMGETGQYPYRAMAAVIQHLPDFLKSETNSIVSDASSFYAHETGFVNRDEEFLVLLRALQNSDVDKNLMAHALETFEQRLTDDPIRTRADYYSEIHTSDGATVPFTDRNQAFLFQAFPAIRRFNPPLAQKLLQQYPQMDNATDKMDYISGGFVMGNPTSDEASRQHAQWIQDSIVSRIKERQSCGDPQSIPPLAQRLTDGSARIVGFSSAIPGIARKNPSEARNIYREQTAKFGDLINPSDQLNAKVGLAQAANSLGVSKDYVLFSRQAFELGVELFNRDSADRSGGGRPKLRVQRLNGFEQLQELVIFTARQPSDTLRAEIHGLSKSWLKAYLLLYEAEGRAKLTAPPKPATPCPD